MLMTILIAAVVCYALFEIGTRVYAKMQERKNNPEAVQADGIALPFDIFALINKLSEAIAKNPIWQKLDMTTDDFERTLESAMIRKLSRRVEESTNDAEKTEGRAALETLAKIVLVPKPAPPKA